MPAVLSAPLKQVRSYAVDAKASPTEVSSILEQRIRGVQEEAGLAETGRVLSVGYDISACAFVNIRGTDRSWLHIVMALLEFTA